jgi:preprotein translocase, yajC subunit
MNLSCNLGGKEMSILASQQAQAWGSIIMWVVIMVVFVYFFMIRPQKKEAKKKEQMMSELAVGDTVLTTSGFYGIVIDVSEDDTVIVEFGSNRNCRIPMQKAAIAAIEKPEEAVEAKETKEKK